MNWNGPSVFKVTAPHRQRLCVMRARSQVRSRYARRSRRILLTIGGRGRPRKCRAAGVSATSLRCGVPAFGDLRRRARVGVKFRKPSLNTPIELGGIATIQPICPLLSAQGAEDRGQKPEACAFRALALASSAWERLAPMQSEPWECADVAQCTEPAMVRAALDGPSRHCARDPRRRSRLRPLVRDETDRECRGKPDPGGSQYREGA